MERAYLYQSNTWEEAWHEVVFPQLKKAERNPSGMVAVVFPYGAWSAYFKARLLDAGHHLLGVHIWTPGQLRRFLTGRLMPEVPLLSDTSLELVASAVSEGHSNGSLAKSIQYSPEGFVRLCNSFHIAGYQLKDIPLSGIQDFALTWEQALAKVNACSLQQGDRRLLQASQGASTACLDQVHFLGFSGRDWGLYPLIRSGIHSAKESTIGLPVDRIAWHEQLWAGTWENLLGASDLLASESHYFEPSVTQSFGEFEAKSSDAVDAYFARHAFDEAKIIVKKALECLKSSETGRVGIVVPCKGVLARELGHLLNEQRIKHYNAVGCHVQSEDAWTIARMWVSWQREGTLSAYSRFVQSLCFAGFIEDATFLSKLEKAFKQGAENTLTEDFDLVCAYLCRCADVLSLDVFEFLTRYKRLPEEGRFQAFLDASLDVLNAWGLGCDEDSFLCEGWLLAKKFDARITRIVYLRWLDAYFRAPSSNKGAYGGNPSSRLYILNAEQADGIEWEHLILTGTQDPSWHQKTRETGTLLKGDVLFSHNQKHVAQGSQGVGHTCMRGEYSLILSHHDKCEETRARLYRLLESADISLTLTASLSEDGKPASLISPNPQFAPLYALGGCPLGDASSVDALCAKGDRYLSGFLDELLINSALQKTTGKPYQVRHDATRSFGPYEYCLNLGKHLHVSIPGRGWEDAIKAPSRAWYRYVLKIEPAWQFSHQSVRAIARGIWVHDWLTVRPSSDAFVPRPDDSLWMRYAEDKAQALKQTFHSLMNTVGRPLPDWWVFDWSHARALVAKFIATLSQTKNYTFIAQEASLPNDCSLALGNSRVPLHGRMDLVLGVKPEASGPFSNNNVLQVIDFKTGAQKPLTKKKLLQGDGLQVAMYAMGLQSLGANNVEASIVSVNGNGRLPQLNVSDMAGLDPLWLAVQRVHEQGCFGQRSDVKARFEREGPFPLATLSIDERILEKKWRLTHPEYLEV